MYLLRKENEMDKYERVYNWTIRELELSIDNHPDENVRGWLKMLKESMEYNLEKQI